MKILAVSDSDLGWPERTGDDFDLTGRVAETSPDLLLSLGDYRPVHGRALASAGAPVTAGVYGNHCTKPYLGGEGPIDLVGDRVTPARLTALTVAGRDVSVLAVQGCLRYKDRSAHGNDVVFDQDEYTAAIGSLGPAEMVITHCPPAGIGDNPDPAHQGIDALREWVDRYSPRWLLHGHTYGSPPVSRYRDTEVFFVYGMELLSLGDDGQPGISQRRDAFGRWIPH